ncbi:predicted protein [Postia placenta Mad-698-R]|uniref:Uncharacterized protein n=1 Tax=Postia placenta MAD-698-R-SB12 TaxID=670580 RepID=A0A1X6MN63_9APHY|nr:hypothetical protein POSPLADRAFT_1060943 [Postia placenta MAD-698-R-SB12]EED81480.1 predicted protein [Postia placenta Mad-698-R]OSX57871.1 hypothetical protein POSPLADRAFT_1060943 [Postia placenta MAD-698-R-SB12]
MPVLDLQSLPEAILETSTLHAAAALIAVAAVEDQQDELYRQKIDTCKRLRSSSSALDTPNSTLQLHPMSLVSLASLLGTSGVGTAYDLKLIRVPARLATWQDSMRSQIPLTAAMCQLYFALSTLILLPLTSPQPGFMDDEEYIIEVKGGPEARVESRVRADPGAGLFVGPRDKYPLIGRGNQRAPKTIYVVLSDAI